MYMIPNYSDDYRRYIRPRLRGGQLDYRTADIAQLKYIRNDVQYNKISKSNFNVYVLSPFHSHARLVCGISHNSYYMLVFRF